MAPSIGVNLRVTGHCSQGGRKYMEDMFSVAYQQTDNEKDLEYAFFGIFDGHGGREAATFAKEHLLDYIVNQKGFWSDKDDDILRAIREGFLQTHLAMWGQLEFWPKTASGLPSNSGTTASIAFVRKGKIYIGHVGDSSIVLGYQDEDDPKWKARPLTKDHKPESNEEIHRIEKSGGKVVSKFGVPRVVWNRPRIGHKGPVRRSTHIDEIPFLAVARSLGDLWSYNPALDVFVVSPEPDIGVVAIDIRSHRCLIFGTDGLWNVLSPDEAVAIVQSAESHNEKHVLPQNPYNMWINPSKSLVDQALTRWAEARFRADNTSVVTLLLDPPGPPRAEVVLNQRKQQVREETASSVPNQQPDIPEENKPKGGMLLRTISSENSSACRERVDNYDPTGGVAIFTRYLAPTRQPAGTAEAPVVPSPDSSSSPSSGRVCKVGDVLHQDSVTKVAGSSADVAESQQRPGVPQIQVNEVSSSKEEKKDSVKIEESASSEKHVLGRQRSSFSFSGGCPAEGFGKMVGFKRRHSSIAKLLGVDNCGDVAAKYEPCQKRRTRSEDKRLSAPPTDEDLNMSDTENKRVAWPVKWKENSSSNKLGSHVQRSSEKVLRQSAAAGSRVNTFGTTGFVVDPRLGHRKSILSEYEVRQETTRVLRSDTAAATPVRTLRSRNVNIHQSSVTPRKTVHRTSLKRSLEDDLRSQVGETSKGLQKRRRHSCWAGARQMTTRSRVRRISK
ncbi:uncharacterized protein Pp2C1 [Anabrus simplex]|uniref:uncharacterized protein Pp2C1 n=1 Tax=Anabrus simplex TaxID=316456 RepID=UPI0034DD6AED